LEENKDVSESRPTAFCGTEGFPAGTVVCLATFCYVKIENTSTSIVMGRWAFRTSSQGRLSKKRKALISRAARISKQALRVRAFYCYFYIQSSSSSSSLLFCKEQLWGAERSWKQ